MNTETREQIKKIIYQAIKLNGGIFDRSLQIRLRIILEKKIINMDEHKYDLSSAINLSKTDIDHITKLLHDPEIEINKTQDNDVIGGFVLKSSSKMIDGSINGYITNLTRQMAEN